MSQAAPRRSAACLACRIRKSRCKFDPNFPAACLMCRSHDTACEVAPRRRRGRPATRQRPNRSSPVVVDPEQGRFPDLKNPTGPRDTMQNEPFGAPTQPLCSLAPSGIKLHTGNSPGNCDPSSDLKPRALDLPEDHGSSERLLGPVLDSDSEVLSDIFYRGLGGRRIVRSVRSDATVTTSSAAIFTESRRRPVGLVSNQSPPRVNLEIIQKLLEPYLTRLVDLFMCKVNTCVPLLNEQEFRKSYDGNYPLQHLSPAFLCCLYAHTLTFWGAEPVLAKHARPDQRFIWNLASEALYSEMRLCPGLYTIAAVLLNAGGRPTSLVFNNVGQLGFATNIAFTLGLNRDPSSWDIPTHEKTLRINIWRSLVIHDRWSSFAYGIPPHILKSYADVIAPPYSSNGAAMIFSALSSLTEVLNEYLQMLHRFHQHANVSDRNSPDKIREWKDSTNAEVRKIVLRGSDLRLPGAANLRMAFLSVQFVRYRIDLEYVRRDCGPMDGRELDEKYLAAREAAEQVVLLVQEIGPGQVEDFWLPEAAFCLSYVMSFLIRSALEEPPATSSGANSSALALAKDFMDSLRFHASSNAWDIADHCISQYSDVLETIRAANTASSVDAIDSETWDALLLDVSFQDSALFSNF